MTGGLCHSRNAVINGPERAMCKPYIKLANEILAQCRGAETSGLGESDLDMICICNDPTVVFGTDAEQIIYRRPDIAFINWHGVRAKGGKHATSWEEARSLVEHWLSERISLELDWNQVLLVDELKRDDVSKDDIEVINKYTGEMTVPYAEPSAFVDERPQSPLPWEGPETDWQAFSSDEGSVIRRLAVVTTLTVRVPQT